MSWALAAETMPLKTLGNIQNVANMNSNMPMVRGQLRGALLTLAACQWLRGGTCEQLECAARTAATDAPPLTAPPRARTPCGRGDFGAVLEISGADDAALNVCRSSFPVPFSAATVLRAARSLA